MACIFGHKIKGKSYLRIACKHGHYCIIFQPSKKREKSVNKLDLFSTYSTQMSWELLGAQLLKY